VQVAAHRLLEVSWRRLQQRSRRRASGVVNQDFERAVGVNFLFYSYRQCIDIFQVARQRRVAAGGTRQYRDRGSAVA